VANEGYQWPAWMKREESPMGKVLTGLQSLLEYEGDLSRWYQLVNRLKLQPGAKIDILLIGGSMASGVISTPEDKLGADGDLACPSVPPNSRGNTCRIGIESGSSGECHRCSFASRFEHWLQKAYPVAKITIHNLALGGHGSELHARILNHRLKLLQERTGMTEIDGVLLHLVDNDHAKADFKDNQDDNRQALLKGRAVEAGYETVVRLVLSRYGHSAVLALQQCGCCSCKNPYIGADPTILNITKPNFIKGQTRGIEGEFSLHSRVNHHYLIPGG
jgi:hypothetical protein